MCVARPCYQVSAIGNRYEDVGQPMHTMIDLRSDVVTTPTAAMWTAMQKTQPDWPPDDDRTVVALEELAATLCGTAAAVLLPTGSVANLLALMALGRRGQALLAHEQAHIVTTEAAGVGLLSDLFVHRLAGPAGRLEPAAVDELLTQARPPTAVLCLENTHTQAGGTVLTSEQTAKLATIARRHGAAIHLDGARLFNAAAALDVPLRALCEPVDTVTLSLNKGLGAPYGAMLCGATATIHEARRLAQALGLASIHRAGLLAAAGIVALTTMTERLPDDHRRAEQLAARLVTVPGLRVVPANPRTNLLLVDLLPASTRVSGDDTLAGGARSAEGQPGGFARTVTARLAERGLLVLTRPAEQLRFAIHHQIDDEAIERAAAIVAAVMAEATRAR